MNGLICLAMFGLAYTPALEEVVVTASRLPELESIFAVERLDADSLQLLSQAGLGDVLSSLAGVTYSNAGGAGKTSTLRIRGEEGYRTQIRIDGIEQADVSAPQVSTAINHLAITPDIGRLDLLAGPQGFFYGADAGGVLNLRSQSVTPGLVGALHLEGGAYDSLRTGGRLAFGGERAGAALAVSRWRTAGFNASRGDVDLADRDGYSNLTLHARGEWQPSAATALSLIVRHVDAETDFDNCGFPASAACVEHYQQNSAGLAAVHLGSRVTQRVSVTTSAVDRENLTDGVLAFGSTGRLSKYEYGARGAIGRWQHAGGVELRIEETAAAERQQLGIFVETLFKPGTDLLLGAGLRFDDNDDFGRHLSLRVNGAWMRALSGSRSFRLRASLGTGFRAPSLFEEGYNAGPFAFAPATGVDLAEEKSLGLEFGVDYMAPTFSASLTAFRQEIEDEIFFDLISFSGYLQDRGDSSSEGATLSFELQLADRWRIDANYMYNHAKTAAGQVRLRRPRHSGAVALDYTALDTRLRLGATLRFANRSEDEVFGVGRAPLSDYGLVDLYAHYLLRPRLRLFVRVNNLLDTKYEQIIGFNNAGAAIYGGLRVEF